MSEELHNMTFERDRSTRGKKKLRHIILAVVQLIALIALIILATLLGLKRVINNNNNNNNISTTTPTAGYDITTEVKNIKYAFTPLTPNCLEKHIIPLGDQLYVNVCNYEKQTIIDIRYFTESDGIYPTIRGVSLNLHQFKQFIANADTIDRYVHSVSSIEVL